LTHILPPGIGGAAPGFDPYPSDTAKAKSMLTAAGVSGLTLKFLYRPSSIAQSKDFQTVQADLGAIGVTVTGVGVPSADFYTKYLEKPNTAKTGVWDLSEAGWSPDWYGDAADSFFYPLFDGRLLPPNSSNFGLLVDPTLYPIIDGAVKATSSSASAAAWHKADMEVMAQAAIFPVSAPNRVQIHGSQVHNCIYVAYIDNCDPTNVWLS
jgi:peptide/nickel transport system substrate-binding protein